MRVCVSCNIQYRPEKNGVYITEFFTDGKPYKVWMADLWKCPKCGHLLITGFGNNPISEHYKDDFLNTLNLSEYSFI